MRFLNEAAQNGQKYKKKTIFSALGVDRDLGFSQGPQTQFFLWFCILPIPLILQKFPQNPPAKSLRNLQNLRKSNFSAFGLDRDLGFSQGLQAHSSPHSEYYPHLCNPQKIPLSSYQLILHKFLMK